MQGARVRDLRGWEGIGGFWLGWVVGQRQGSRVAYAGGENTKHAKPTNEADEAYNADKAYEAGEEGDGNAMIRPMTRPTTDRYLGKLQINNCNLRDWPGASVTKPGFGVDSI